MYSQTVYRYIHMHTQTHTHRHMHIHTDTYISACTLKHINTHIHANMHTLLTELDPNYIFKASFSTL